MICYLQVGYEDGGKYYINNHLMFKILVHRTNGQYTRSRENMAELEAASIIEVIDRVFATQIHTILSDGYTSKPTSLRAFASCET